MNFYDGIRFAAFGSSPTHHENFRREPLYYGIQYNHSGSFRLKIGDGQELVADGPFAFITHPGVVFEYGYIDETTRHHNHICVCGDRVERSLDSGLLLWNDASPLIRVKQPERFLSLMLDIIAMLRKNAPATPPRAVLMYEDLLLQLFHECPLDAENIPAFHRDFFTVLIARVRSAPADDWDFEKISRKHGLTFRHFRRLFKTLSGLPPQQFLIQCRLQLAAAMLVKSSDTVNTIAENAGFGSNIYFSRIFKQHYRITPLEYRREFSFLP